MLWQAGSVLRTREMVEKKTIKILSLVGKDRQ